MSISMDSLDGAGFDVCVIGAGINGTSAAARLAKDGYSVLLIDKGDFGSGASSRSSRLLHCGLSQVGSLRDAKGVGAKCKALAAARLMMQERTRLVQSMPEKLRATHFYIPLFGAKPAKRWEFSTAFKILKFIGGGDVPLDYRSYGAKEMRSDPFLQEFGSSATGAISFRDYVFDWPERICIDYAKEAERYSAVIRNYTELVSASRRPDGWKLLLCDSTTPQKTITVDAKIILNLAGAWADSVNEKIIQRPSQTLARTKGCHVAVRLPPHFAGKGVVTATETGHMFICTPWRGFHILGPTEEIYEGDPHDAQATDHDVRSILDQANALMPSLALKPSDVLWKYAGVRPVTFAPGHPRGVWNRRFYDLGSDASPLVSLSWGRVIDHADTAERLLETVKAKLGGAENSRGRAQPAHVSHEVPALEAYPRSVTDILFRRTGRGWDADLGMPDVDAAAKALADQNATQSEDDLRRAYHSMLEARFGYCAQRQER